MTKRPAPTGAGKSAPATGGSGVDVNQNDVNGRPEDSATDRSAADSPADRSMIAVAEQDAEQRDRLKPRGRRTQSDSGGDARPDRRTVVVIGLLHLAPGTSLRGDTFIALSQALRATALPDREQTTVDLWLDSPGGGLWTRKGIPLQKDWASGLPKSALGTLTDQAALDRWASRQTRGVIDTFPLELTPGTALVLASALAARVKWRDIFDTSPRGSRESTEPDEQWLSRTTLDTTVAAVLDDAVTRVVVEGDGDVDVHLLIGERDPAGVLSTGLGELCGDIRARPVTEHDSGGPGLTVSRISSWDPDDILRLRLPSFAITARHDLLQHTDLFGLRSVTDPITSHLPRLSPAPLFVSEGAQEVVARFFAKGFEAAAVTAFDIAVTGALPHDDQQVTLVEVSFNRPFGFLAVHRTSRLAVVAGWVDSPFREDA